MEHAPEIVLALSQRGRSQRHAPTDDSSAASLLNHPERSMFVAQKDALAIDSHDILVVLKTG